MQNTNTVVILSDEHNRNVLGCYGDRVAKTPNLDALAARGTLFSNAYCNSPVCVPSRASLATGCYPHQIHAWDSTAPYFGSTKGWARQLRDQGHEVVSIGKLHYRSRNDDNGFSEEIAPMHVHNGTGWLTSLLRDPPAPLVGAELMAQRIGPGETDYTQYDRDITQLTCEWIRAAAAKQHDKPWVLYVGLVAPHFPLIAPQAFYDLYEGTELPAPRQYAEAERPRHPVIEAMRTSSNYDQGFDEDKIRIALQSYYGLVSFLDHNIGQILAALTESGLLDDTRVIYTTDHGENLGNRGLWGKSVMYDDAAALPMIAAGPDLPEGLQVATPVSLVDIAPTLLEFAGATLSADDTRKLPGESLTARFDAPAADRSVFSEYHDWSSITGMFMLRTRDWKIVRYPGYDDQLFDMCSDPLEETDLAGDPAYAAVLNEMRSRLAAILDVERVNMVAFTEQRAKIEALGGSEAILAGDERAYTPAPTLATEERLADPLEP